MLSPYVILGLEGKENVYQAKQRVRIARMPLAGAFSDFAKIDGDYSALVASNVTASTSELQPPPNFAIKCEGI